MVKVIGDLIKEKQWNNDNKAKKTLEKNAAAFFWSRHYDAKCLTLKEFFCTVCK